jgi:rRNA maturation protein Nop10
MEKVLIGQDTTNLVTHNIYPDGLSVNPNMMDPNIGGFRKCKHIYEYVGSEVCPLCGRYTHEPNYELQNKLHKQWIADGKNKDLLCPLGGSIIGAWDI